MGELQGLGDELVVKKRVAGEHAEVMKGRTKAVAVMVLKMVGSLKPGVGSRVIAGQVVRSATSVGANYRSAQRARSRKEFLAKLGVVVEEADETLYWIEVAVEAGLLEREQAKKVWREMNEIVKVLVSSVRSVRQTKLTSRPQR